MKKVVCMALIALFAGAACAQELGEKVVVSSTVGDTLKLSQRDHFGLFPDIGGFNWAVFFLSGDSIINAKVDFDNPQGGSSDTLLMHYGTLRELHSKIRAGETLPIDSAQVELKDGTVFSGIVVGETATRIVLVSSRFGQVIIPSAEVHEIARQESTRPGGFVSLVKDPNQTRAFLMPTATTPPPGTGYIADYELIFFTAAVGVTDWLMVNGGTLLLPVPVEDMIFDYGVKARLFEIPDKFAVAAGIQMLGGGLFEDVSGIGYGIISIGNYDRKVNLAVGDAFSGSNGELLFGISGDARVSGSIKLVAELWILENASWAPLVVGVRFFGNRLSGDIGLLYPIGESLGSPIGIPVVSLTYAF
jgi:hypothetical protein